MIGIGEGASLI